MREQLFFVCIVFFFYTFLNHKPTLSKRQRGCQGQVEREGHWRRSRRREGGGRQKERAHRESTVGGQKNRASVGRELYNTAACYKLRQSKAVSDRDKDSHVRGVKWSLAEQCCGEILAGRGQPRLRRCCEEECQVMELKAGTRRAPLVRYSNMICVSIYSLLFKKNMSFYFIQSFNKLNFSRLWCIHSLLLLNVSSIAKQWGNNDAFLWLKHYRPSRLYHKFYVSLGATFSMSVKRATQ